MKYPNQQQVTGVVCAAPILLAATQEGKTLCFPLRRDPDSASALPQIIGVTIAHDLFLDTYNDLRKGQHLDILGSLKKVENGDGNDSSTNERGTAHVYELIGMEIRIYDKYADC